MANTKYQPKSKFPKQWDTGEDKSLEKQNTQQPRSELPLTMGDSIMQPNIPNMDGNLSIGIEDTQKEAFIPDFDAHEPIPMDLASIHAEVSAAERQLADLQTQMQAITAAPAAETDKEPSLLDRAIKGIEQKEPVDYFEQYFTRQEEFLARMGITPQDFQRTQELQAEMGSLNAQLLQIEAQEQNDILQTTSGTQLSSIKGAHKTEISRRYAVEKAGVAAQVAAKTMEYNAIQGRIDQTQADFQKALDFATYQEKQAVDDHRWALNFYQGIEESERKWLQTEYENSIKEYEIARDEKWEQLNFQLASYKATNTGLTGVGYVPNGLTLSQSEILDGVGLEPYQKENVAAIMRGDSPPFPPNVQRTEVNLKIMSGLGALGFNSVEAFRDHTAMMNTVKNLTSGKALELRRAIISLEGSTEQAERIYGQWQATGLPGGFSTLNKATLETMARLPGNAGVQARTLISHIEDMAAELAIVYRGGGQATDDALAQAKRSLSADWNQGQFEEALDLIRENLQIRRNSISQAIDEVTVGNLYNWNSATVEDEYNDYIQQVNDITPEETKAPIPATNDPGLIRKFLNWLIN